MIFEPDGFQPIADAAAARGLTVDEFEQRIARGEIRVARARMFVEQMHGFAEVELVYVLGEARV